MLTFTWTYQHYHDVAKVVQYAFGAIANLAEVHSLRPRLMRADLLDIIWSVSLGFWLIYHLTALSTQLDQTTNNQLTYNIVGVVCNLLAVVRLLPIVVYH